MNIPPTWLFDGLRRAFSALFFVPGLGLSLAAQPTLSLAAQPTHSISGSIVSPDADATKCQFIPRRTDVQVQSVTVPEALYTLHYKKTV